MSLWFILVAIGLLAASGAPGLCLGWRSMFGQWLATAIAVVGSALGLFGAAWVLHSGGSGGGGEASLLTTWVTPFGPLGLGVDALGAFFLVPIFLMGGLGPIYGMSYWRQTQHPRNARQLRFFYGLMAAALALVVLARNGVLFLAAWEVMALAAFFLITTEDDDESVREAGWLYLIATHAGTLCLFTVFAPMFHATGSFALVPLTPEQGGHGLRTVIFMLGVVGFGLKAGIMPLHFWLPGAHASAPSHVSAIMSGVMIKMGIYGLIRITGLLPNPPVGWGAVLLILGAISGVLGVVFAIAQHDFKRLLAYHSIENIGIIVMGLGLAMLGRSLGRDDWIVLGLGGCLLHVWNHALFKSLLFLSAGSVLHATGTRQIDRLGGLAKTMPRTAALFLVGAVAICGLPPLNGFVSELLIYLGLFRTIGGPHALGASSAGVGAYPGAALAIPALAMIGALAVACFVKVFGAVFLGTPRSSDAEHAHEAPASMIGPMVVLAGACAAIGLSPLWVGPILDRAIAAWTPGSAPGAAPAIATLVPLGWISVMGVALVGFAGTIAVVTTFLIGKRRRRNVDTWDCGYAVPVPRAQYTSSSFAQSLVAQFRWVLRPHRHRPQIEGAFPTPSQFDTHVGDIVLDGAIMPAARSAVRLMSWFRVIQQGLVQHYVLYILITMLLLLVSMISFYDLFERVLVR